MWRWRHRLEWCGRQTAQAGRGKEGFSPRTSSENAERDPVRHWASWLQTDQAAWVERSLPRPRRRRGLTSGYRKTSHLSTLLASHSCTPQASPWLHKFSQVPLVGSHPNLQLQVWDLQSVVFRFLTSNQEEDDVRLNKPTLSPRDIPLVCGEGGKLTANWRSEQPCWASEKWPNRANRQGLERKGKIQQLIHGYKRRSLTCPHHWNSRNSVLSELKQEKIRLLCCARLMHF